jgi:hypothetical protein
VLFVVILALVVLVCCWFWGNASLRTKLLLTAIYGAIWASILIPEYGTILFSLGQIAFIVVVGSMTFGIEWLSRRI